MRLVTLFLPQITETDLKRIALFRDFLSFQIARTPGDQAVAAYVILGRAREKLERSPHLEEVDIVTSVYFAHSALQSLDKYRGTKGAWLEALHKELHTAIMERTERDKEKDSEPTDNFDAVARRARTVRERYAVHRGPEGEDEGS